MLLCCAVTNVVTAQVAIERPNFGIPTKIGPAYFGPNAFPVPDMLDGRTSSKLKVEMYGDCFLGTTTSSIKDDITTDLFLRVTIPLFTPKVNISVWMPIFEYFYTSSEVNAIRRLPFEDDLKGFSPGDVYISTNVLILNEKRHYCDLVARAALKTASANHFIKGRCYDAPGYFFDFALGRQIVNSRNHSLRAVLSCGFLCWQTDMGRQNDALMYGAQLSYRYRKVSFATEFGSYMGWERDGDHPKTLKTRLSYSFGKLSLNLSHQVGFADWPYHQIRLGATYAFDIFSDK